MKASDFAAVILTYGPQPRHQYLSRTLCEQGVDPEAIAVVHNPAVQGDYRCYRHDGVEVVRNATNLGYGSAINVGLRRPQIFSKTAVVIVADDVRLADDALAHFAVSAGIHQKVGIFGPTLRLTTGEIFSAGGRSSKMGIVGHAEDAASLAKDGLALCDWVDAAAWVIRTDVFRDVGLLEERYFMYYEEPLICLRARRCGWDVGTVTGAVADQTPGTLKRPAAYAYLMTRNGLHYARAVAGRAGAAHATRVAVANAARDLRKSRDPAIAADARPIHALRATGTMRGLWAAARSHWGPPPPLPGPSDIVMTSGS
jgi:GT2 family glycosyltransferase